MHIHLLQISFIFLLGGSGPLLKDFAVHIKHSGIHTSSCVYVLATHVLRVICMSSLEHGCSWGCSRLASSAAVVMKILLASTCACVVYHIIITYMHKYCISLTPHPWSLVYTPFTASAPLAHPTLVARLPYIHAWWSHSSQLPPCPPRLSECPLSPEGPQAGTHVHSLLVWWPPVGGASLHHTHTHLQ